MKERTVPSQQDSPPRLSDDLTSDDLTSDDLTSNDLTSVIAQQEKIFVERQPESARMAHRAERSLAGGVTSSWQITVPQPVWLSHGKGSKIYDVDGNEYIDLHGGYGAALAGHAHPAIVEAVHSQVGLGTHFAQPTQNAVAVGEEIGRASGRDK